MNSHVYGLAQFCLAVFCSIINTVGLVVSREILVLSDFLVKKNQCMSLGSTLLYDKTSFLAKII